MRSLLFAIPLILAGPLAACDGSEPETDPTVSKSAPVEEAFEGEGQQDIARIGSAESPEHGRYLTNARGMALYMFTADTQGEASACYDACAGAWPPMLSAAAPLPAGNAAKPTMLGMLERDGGALQATYNGWPLYTFVRDQEPGDVTGQGVQSFGGVWYLIAPSGKAITGEGGGAEGADETGNGDAG